MPFKPEFDDVYTAIKDSVKRALPAENIRCYRLDDNLHAGRISDELLTAIRSAAFCVADSTGSNANVMWEIGYAMALKKPVIFLHQEDSPLPFDLQDMRGDQIRAYLIGQNPPAASTNRDRGDYRALQASDCKYPYRDSARFGSDI